MASSFVTSILHTFRLLLPAIIPSWRFFDIIAPSPRIEYAVLSHKDDDVHMWQEFRPRPETLPARRLLERLFYNPQWNENLYLISCAERLLAQPTTHSVDEIFARLATELSKRTEEPIEKPYLRFRLIILFRHENEIIKNTAYTSDTRSCFKAAIT